jgi:hypothetical protein
LKSAHDVERRHKWIQFLLFQRRLTDAENALIALLAGSPAMATPCVNWPRSACRKTICPAPLHGWNNGSTLSRGKARRGGSWETGMIKLGRSLDAVAAYAEALTLLPYPADTQRALAWLLATDTQGDGS